MCPCWLADYGILPKRPGFLQASQPGPLRNIGSAWVSFRECPKAFSELHFTERLAQMFFDFPSHLPDPWSCTFPPHTISEPPMRFYIWLVVSLFTRLAMWILVAFCSILIARLLQLVNDRIILIMAASGSLGALELNFLSASPYSCLDLSPHFYKWTIIHNWDSTEYFM